MHGAKRPQFAFEVQALPAARLHLPVPSTSHIRPVAHCPSSTQNVSKAAKHAPPSQMNPVLQSGSESQGPPIAEVPSPHTPPLHEPERHPPSELQANPFGHMSTVSGGQP